TDADEILVGDPGAETLQGGGGDDGLWGRSGDDSLNGGSGDDTLLGGQGDDSLTGGSGSDTFRWVSGDQGTDGSASVTDTITDFSVAEDVLHLDDLLPALVDENTSAADLTEYLNFSFDGVNTVMHVDHDGGGTFEPTLDIVLGGAGDLTNGGATSDDEIILSLNVVV
ncbi:unnamed protein product, partial [Ectocarpus sp. 13 AM-2016]